MSTPHRLFETSTERNQFPILGSWEFILDPGNVGRENEYFSDFPSDDADEIYSPLAWNIQPEYYQYEGVAWYHKSIRINTESNVKITFLAVAHSAEVYIDGELVKTHYGGYTPFSIYLSEMASGTHNITVRVDNTHSNDTIPKSRVDWPHYGGITRDIIVEEVNDVIIDDLRVDYDITDNGVSVNAHVKTYNFNQFEVDQKVEIFIDEDAKKQTDLAMSPGHDSAELEFELNDVRLWQPGDPKLYQISAELESDDYRDRTGFRDIEINGTDICINGDKVEIDGVNRHEDHPDWGHGLPPQIIKRDIDIINHLGVNAVRTSHYPNHPLFLDYCDQEGILVIEEIPYWQYEPDDFDDSIVLERGKQMLSEMICRDINRPSIFAWSLHNECETQTDRLYDVTKELAAVARSYDQSRPLTFATNNPYEGKGEICVELADFICLNGYWGWYSDESNWDEFLEGFHRDYPNKPIIISEFGAGGIYGERGFEKRKWSETYQRDLLKSAITTFKNKEYVSGYYIWQYCDTNTAQELEMSRPAVSNNKGIVNAYRRPKDAYWTIKNILSE